MEIRANGKLDFDRSVSSRSARQLKIDMEDVDYFGLYGLAGIACCVLSAANSGVTINFSGPESLSASNFISRVGFDEFFRETTGVNCNLGIASNQDPKDVLVKFKRIETSQDLEPLQDLLELKLERVAGPQVRSTLNEALWELGANVTEHSKSIGVVGAVVQRPNRKGEHIDFAIGDAGIGIRESFLRGSRPYHPESDHEAIEMATRYLVSSVADPGRGQGLHYVIEQVLGLNGTVVIRSGEAKRRMFRGNQSNNEVNLTSKSESVPNVNGTLVFVSIPCR